ncbi:MAG: trypsin-like serine protease, partial [Pseudohongiellaceae bacterium]
MKKSAGLILICLLPWTQLPVSAIIIRHDSSSASYQVQEADYPAVFYLEMQGSRKVCVATLIDSRWAITAAHCMHETSLAAALQGPEPFTVLVAGRPQTIVETVVHPNSGSGNFHPQTSNEVDLALLRFEQPMDFPRPVPLYEGTQELNQIVTLLGWGFYGLGTTGRQYDDGRF